MGMPTLNVDHTCVPVVNDGKISFGPVCDHLPLEYQTRLNQGDHRPSEPQRGCRQPTRNQEQDIGGERALGCG